MSNEYNIKKLRNKYDKTAYFYDLLDFPWEYFVYSKLRPALLSGVSGAVLEAGVGTGRNLPYYNKDVILTAIDASSAMIKKAQCRAKLAKCKVNFLNASAHSMPEIASNQFDWVISTFLCCVLPNELQEPTINEFVRVLKPGGRFKLLEITYSKDPKLRFKQKLLSKYVEKVFGARFDRNTLDILINNKTIQITNKQYVRDDTYLLIEGKKL